MNEANFNIKSLLKIALNPHLKFKSENLGNYLGISKTNREIPIILSLTSNIEKFNGLELTLYSLLQQTKKPDKIILWLDDKYELVNLPYEITKFIKNGLEIRLIKDKKSYTDLIYTLKEYANCVVITAGDENIYPKDWLEKLYISYIANPNDIQVHFSYNANFSDEKFLPYKTWKKSAIEGKSKFDNFPLKQFGILYPPNCFIKEIFREDIFNKLAPDNPNLWIWLMAIISNRKIRVVKNHIKTFTGNNFIRTFFAFINYNRLNAEYGNKTDKQLSDLEKLYGRNIWNKLM